MSSSFELRHITDAEYEEARILWNICFPEDADGYSEYYFKYRTECRNVLAAFCDGRMISGLHAVPYPLRFGGKVKECAMIAGVATLPEFRHKGAAASLIRMAHAELASRGVAAALLKPDVDFYAQFGYVPFSWQEEYTLTSSDAARFAPLVLHDPSAAELLKIYDAFASRYEGMMARSLHTMELYIKENALSGFAVTDGESYALCADADGAVDIYELAGSDPVRLAAQLARKYGKVSFRLPEGYDPNNMESRGRIMFSMLCPLDGARLVEGTGAKCLKELLSRVCCTLEYC